MKRMKSFLLLIALFAAINTHAQEGAIEAILNKIEANNPQLKANSEAINAQKLQNKADNNLPDPTLTYAHLWDSDNSERTVGELVVAQSFDFPTLYISRGKMNRLRTGALDAQAQAFRQEVLLQAQELCLDIIMLHQQQALLDVRLKNAEELAAMYAKRLEAGDANVLETNKINLELLNVRTEARLNEANLQAKLKELSALNGEEPLGAGRPLADGAPYGAAALGLTSYPNTPMPLDFEPLCNELLSLCPTLQSLSNEGQAMRKQLSINKQGWIPKLQLGYRRNTESGHPLNGVVVGFSFPLFENRSKVKIAKSEVSMMQYQQDNAHMQATTKLRNLYEEAYQLNASIKEYQQVFAQQQDLELLKKALIGGEISMIEYFVEVGIVFQSKANLINLENQYQKTMARLYQNKL